jgi:GGDEF domain-containing protein
MVNDNAAGLRGGGAAVEYLRKVMDRAGDGFVVVFRLSCLDVISTRFGLDAVHDCLMSISAFLTSSLQSDDAIFHWSDSALMAILQGRVNEQILTAELQRIISRHRESTVTIGGRSIMLRIPIAYELTPISVLQSPEDLYRLPARKAAY